MAEKKCLIKPDSRWFVLITVIYTAITNHAQLKLLHKKKLI